MLIIDDDWKQLSIVTADYWLLLMTTDDYLQLFILMTIHDYLQLLVTIDDYW